MAKRNRNFVFTLNNPTEDEWVSITQCTTQFSEICMQEETGEKGTPHIQGYVRCKNGKTFEAVKKIIGERIHIEACKDRVAAIKYCSKDDTRTGRQFKFGIKEEEPPKVFEPTRPLNRWQQELLDHLETVPDKRQVKWIWCSEGASGKTDIAKYYCSKNRGKGIFVTGASKDIKCGVAKHLENSQLKTVIFGLTRSVEDFVSYQAIEEIKDGIFFSGKYESGMVMFDNPHVVILANFPPDESKLSADRWDIVCLDLNPFNENMLDEYLGL